jgi:hypothetical protein
MKRAALIGLSVLAVLVLGGATIARRWTRRSDVVAVRAIPEAERAPAGQRVRVQVLNATRTRGLGRHASLFLRDRGFDVVEVGTLNQQRDTTLVLDLSGHPEWAKRVAAAFDGARIETRRDSSRYLDVAVLVGASWRPPTEAFYP